MYPNGTRIEAEAGYGLYSLAGPLVGDHECLDSLVTLYDEANDEIVVIKGWLWSIEVVNPDPLPIA